MDQHILRILIRTKLGDGRLPANSMPRVWGGPGNSEICDGCEEIVTKEQFVMEGISLANGRKPLQMHVACFHVWDDERRVLPVRP